MTYYSVVHASALDSVQKHITHIMRFYCCLQMTTTFVTIFYEVIPYCIILYHVIGLQSCYNMPLLSLRRATLLNSNITNYASVQSVMTNQNILRHIKTISHDSVALDAVQYYVKQILSQHRLIQIPTTFASIL